MDPERRLAAKRANERLKLVANFLNALAVGTIGAGAIIPASRTPVEIGWLSGAWLLIGLILHSLGHSVFKLMRSED